MERRYPEIEPFEQEVLDTGDGHQVYWEACGNPDGIPALYLHGGPGSGFSPGQRRFFDPDAYRAVLFDQRGAGQSRPLANEPDADLSTNTTQHLIADIEALRELHEVDRWVILGLSWGTTLALAYAQAHPDRVRGLVLGLVTTTSRREVEWITEDMGRVFPREWDRFAAAVPERFQGMRLIDAYAAMLRDPDPALQEHAAREWCVWEDVHVSLAPGFQPSLRYEDPEFRLRFARLVTHYWSNAAFLEEDQIVRDAATLNGIPGYLIHGRYDISSPLQTAWELSKRWTTSRLTVMQEGGHGGDELPGLVVAALDELARA
ncbi:MAG TPA: prolyl aminopeptidase [Thermomicrobiales bacterium]|nr:prolyl aminopeptidase [Thermomicrobiales bacterium]